MTIEIRDGRYFAAMWFIAGDGHDWHAALYHDAAPEAPWELVFRFRYYDDNEIHDSQDHKSWYKSIAPRTRTEEQVVADVERLVADLMTSGRYDERFPTVVIQSDRPEAVADKLSRQPWAHGKGLGKGDA